MKKTKITFVVFVLSFVGYCGSIFCLFSNPTLSGLPGYLVFSVLSILLMSTMVILYLFACLYSKLGYL